MYIDPSAQPAVRFFWFKLESVIVIFSYLLGSIPFGLLVARARGIDIRQRGSGNIGATNVLRVLGKGPGYTVFALDALKGLVAVFAAKYLATRHVLTYTAALTIYQGTAPSILHETGHVTIPAPIAAITAAILCIIGHNLPVWLRFKGGKGMATSCGVLIGMMPLTAIACLIVWAAVFLGTRYVSLASIAASITLPLATMIFLLTGLLTGWPYFYFAVAACLLAIWRHRDNIVRLIAGTENRFDRKPASSTPA